MKISNTSLLLLCILLFLGINSSDGFWRRRRRRRSPSPPVQPPSYPAPTFSSCPGSWTVPTAALQTVVTWSTPTVEYQHYYQRGPCNGGMPCFTMMPTVVQTSGPTSGTSLEEGSHHVVYTATDFQGKSSTCAFHITVEVIRCPAISSANNRVHVCTYGVRAGSQCTFSCHHGYRIIGGATVHCDSNTRRWSSSFPTCQALTCNPPLSSPPYGSISCTDGNRYMSMCFFHCNEGYAIPAGQTSARYCNGHAWTGQQPTCQDIKPPVFTSCPTSFDVNVNVQSSNSESAVIQYNMPRATDNSGHVTLRRVLGKASGSQFGSGTNTIKYTAEDGAGNIVECNFTINVVIIVVMG